MVEPLVASVDELAKAQFVIPGEPRPLLRARSRQGQGRVYDPKQNRSARRAVIAAWEAAGAVRFADVPLYLAVHCFFGRPKSHYVGCNAERRLLRPDAPRFVTKVPDLSNLVKLVEDALKGHAYSDDKLIAWGGQSKQWVDPPLAQTIITIRELRDTVSP